MTEDRETVGKSDALPSRLPKEPAFAVLPHATGRWARIQELARMDLHDIMRTEGWQHAASMYVPAVFLGWAVYGMLRPAFDPSMAFEPIFWAVGGASLLTLYGRLSTRDIEVDDDDLDEPLEDKWRFTIPHLWRKGPRP